MNIDFNISKTRVIFFWEGFPPCGLLLMDLKNYFGDNLTIIATRAKVNFPNFEILYPNLKIYWLDYPNQIWKLRHDFSVFDVIIHTGWSHSGWIKYSKWMKSNNNSRLYLTVDNVYTGSFRQYLGLIYFRLRLKNIYDGVFVPGNATSRYMKFLGMPFSRIFCGIYGAYQELYYSKGSISERKNEFFFVGQLITRKGLDTLIKAFRLYRENGGKWDLRISGSGPLEYLCVGDGILFDGFLNPIECATKMRNSKCFILPSRLEHWGTVVCEAAASGMVLLLSTKIGSSDDILRNGINGYLFESDSDIDLAHKMQLISKWDEVRYHNASNISISISKAYDSTSFYNGFLSLIEKK
jgi:glycosyltransferase involved in cell wall biosynthesis